MKGYTKGFIIAGSIAILLGTASWAFYGLINRAIKDLMNFFKMTNPYIQGFIILIVVILMLVVLGFGFKKGISKILGM